MVVIFEGVILRILLTTVADRLGWQGVNPFVMLESSLI